MKELKKEYIRLESKGRLHQCPNPLIGLTGGIATGKSTVSQILRDQGVHLICADELIHQIYNEEETIEKVSTLCPDALSNGHINFQILRKFFFSNPSIRKELELFLYARLPRVFNQSLPEDHEQVVIYDVPLLFEKNMQESFDQIICVFTSPENQLKRLQLRDGTDLETHQKVIEAQWPLEKKKSQSSFVIENNSDLDNLQRETLQLTKKIFN